MEPSGNTAASVISAVVITVLALAVALRGASLYLGCANVAEARATVAAIARAARGGYEREYAVTDAVCEDCAPPTRHDLCDSAVAVPGQVPGSAAYRPVSGRDFDTGDALAGWRCLRFSMVQPIHYQYDYRKDGSILARDGACREDCFEASAVGDRDDDLRLSRFTLTGRVRAGEIAFERLRVDDEHE